ncbi:P-loop containing nucleoside triphosphate hydrolase protein [Staphylotrichum tortipilum]|uniref:P-loop containing nucleoside triphosphate hydrolase protein n=1 Tax=Staphylotrichum tortipilum TaxID=2831512 RepID=A0AAN6MNK1_9PEZI|nr:P-loop containing nucleoside triphosphate hydrolase protein [Staphylotrichum longicolle]
MTTDLPINPVDSDDIEVVVVDDDASVTTDAMSAAGDGQVRRLYRHDCEYGSCPSRWSRFSVNEEAQAELEAEANSMKIVHRHTYDSNDKSWNTASFTINCPVMRTFLGEALANYQDMDPDLEGWTFALPYNALVHRWDRLQALHQELKDTADQQPKQQAADQLVSFMEPILASSVQDLASIRATGKINYDDLWQIFPPGETVLTTMWGVQTVCRVTKYYKSRSRLCYDISVEYVDWDGEKCGWQPMTVSIPWYAGLTRVTGLLVYPLRFAHNRGEIEEAMTARGRRFEQLRGYHFLNYRGVRVPMDTEGEEQPVSGRVVIDAFAYYRSNNLVKPAMRILRETAEANDNDTELVESNGDGDDNEEADNGEAEYEKDAEVDEAEVDDEETPVAAPMSVTRQSKSNSRVEDLPELSDVECLLATPWLVGYDLKQKEWGRFLIDNLSDIEWSDKAFDNLVLPGGEKELAWEFVESKAKSEEVIDDFVPEKGRGIIILLFGPPGVGKTYTAEAVAEKARVPLYQVSAAMLGSSPEVVEPALTRALELCRLWNAMLLLDEADIFLGARLDDSLTRNELVSVFLTKLEYYQGILFLTTNRFSRIDYAFQSRIDLLLPYHDLDAAARKQVWQNFLDHFGPDKFGVSDQDLDRLARLPLNGREIKNLLKSAQLLTARRKEPKVTAERLYMLADKRVAALKMLAEHNDNAVRN